MKTKEVTNDNNPNFNERIEILTSGFTGSELVFKVDDADVFPNRDDPIGSVKLTLGPVCVYHLKLEYRLNIPSPGGQACYILMI